MGKRAKKVTLKKMARPRLETVFSCPLCSHEKCIECRMDRGKQTGTARCRVCTAGYQTVITYLSDPVDVYSEWVDVIAEREKSENGGNKDGRSENVGSKDGAVQGKHDTIVPQEEAALEGATLEETASEETTLEATSPPKLNASRDVAESDDTGQSRHDRASSDDDDDFLHFIKEKPSPQKGTIIESDEE